MTVVDYDEASFTSKSVYCRYGNITAKAVKAVRIKDDNVDKYGVDAFSVLPTTQKLHVQCRSPKLWETGVRQVEVLMGNATTFSEGSLDSTILYV